MCCALFSVHSYFIQFMLYYIFNYVQRLRAKCISALYQVVLLLLSMGRKLFAAYVWMNVAIESGGYEYSVLPGRKQLIHTNF
jgi:hypothetical protein